MTSNANTAEITERERQRQRETETETERERERERLRDFEVQMDHLIQARRFDLVIEK